MGWFLFLLKFLFWGVLFTVVVNYFIGIFFSLCSFSS